jgi:hypothetical protein
MTPRPTVIHFSLTNCRPALANSTEIQNGVTNTSQNKHRVESQMSSVVQ